MAAPETPRVLVLGGGVRPPAAFESAVDGLSLAPEHAASTLDAAALLAVRPFDLLVVLVDPEHLPDPGFLRDARSAGRVRRVLAVIPRRPAAALQHLGTSVDDVALPPLSAASLQTRIAFALAHAAAATPPFGGRGVRLERGRRTLPREHLVRAAHRPRRAAPKTTAPEALDVLPLGGRPARAAFVLRLDHVLRHRGDLTAPFAVLVLDIDRFKSVNFSLGHDVGDSLLDAVAQRIRTSLRAPTAGSRPGATVAHLGGDRFAILVEGLADAADPVRVAKRIQEELQAPFALAGTEVRATACIGIVTVSTSHVRAEDMIRDADAALMRAKATGQGSIAVFDLAMARTTASRASLESELQRAVANDEFTVHYQPIVTIADGRLAGFEALARWQLHGQAVPPSEFIPLAEDMGLIVEIDRHVMRAACRQLHAWDVKFRRAAPLWIAVNVSGKQFLRADMLVEIDRALRLHGVWGRRLKLEITESVIMEHALFAEELLKQLKSLEITLSIDDFGTGYSSLAYLRRFEIDTLKIDRSFVLRMDVDRESWEIVRAISTLANNLGKGLVAEGIERGRQRELLQALRCELGQGTFFSPAVDATTATSFIAAFLKGEGLLRTTLPPRVPSAP